ncbi:MAG: helix-turn-helix domain-containing protein [Exilibacterium sp.]
MYPVILPDSSDHSIAQLAHLGFMRFAPAPALRPWIQCYWRVYRVQLPEGGLHENLYPDGGTSLTFDLPVTTTDIPARSGAFNAQQQINQINFRNSFHCLGIRFHPGGAFQLLGLDLGSMTGKEFDLDLLGSSYVHLQDQLRTTFQVQQQITLLDKWLLDAANQQQARQGIIQRLLPLLQRDTADIAQLSERAALSRRQLERRFQLEVGLSPKQLHLLHRIKQARQLISRAPQMSLTDVSLMTGFYDQAHFIRQFHKVTQQTPGQYRARKMSQKYNTKDV